MKLVCINKKMPGRDSDFKYLTIGKVYNTIGIPNIENKKDNLYCIKDDSNWPCWHLKSNFIELDKWREDKINEVFNEEN